MLNCKVSVKHMYAIILKIVMLRKFVTAYSSDIVK